MSGLHFFESADSDETERWVRERPCLYFNVIWTIMYIGRRQDGEVFIWLAEGMPSSLLITTGHRLRPRELRSCSMPECVKVFKHYPSTFFDWTVCKLHSALAFEDIEISVGVDQAGRGFVYVVLEEDVHLILREPGPDGADEGEETDVQLILASDAAPVSRTTEEVKAR